MLNKIRIVHSTLSDQLYLIRHGKDPHLALEKRECEKDVMCALVEYMMYNSPKGATKSVTIGDRSYCIKVTPEPTP